MPSREPFTSWLLALAHAENAEEKAGKNRLAAQRQENHARHDHAQRPDGIERPKAGGAPGIHGKNRNAQADQKKNRSDYQAGLQRDDAKEPVELFIAWQ